MRRLPLAVLATVDPVLRDTAVMTLLVDGPGTVVLRHDIQVGGEDGTLRRLVLDSTGVVEDQLLPLEHACLSCAVREDAVPTLARLAATGRWSRLVLALPVSAGSLPATRALADATRAGGPLSGLRVSSVTSVLDLATVETDLLDDDLLDERGLALTPDDRRAVGEAVAGQLEHADHVLVAGDRAEHPVGSDLVEHLRAPGTTRTEGLDRLDPAALFASVHDVRRAGRRLDPRQVRALPGPTRHGVWTVELRSPRPFHPVRLVERIADLGSGRVRSRGVFWVPSRPDSACGWDGVGGQLGIGHIGGWGPLPARTHLVVTGTGDEEPVIRGAFADVLLTDAEAAEGLLPWLGREDVLEPWLGERARP